MMSKDDQAGISQNAQDQGIQEIAGPRACPKCGFVSVNPIECPSCGVIFSKAVDPALAKFQQEKQRRARLFEGRLDDRFSQGGLLFHLLMLPGAALVALFLAWLKLPTFLLDWFAVFLHEVGHASIHWLSGRAAMPVALGPCAGWATGNLHPSLWVGLCALFLIGVIGVVGIRHRSHGLVGLAIFLLMGQIYFSLLAPTDTWEAVMIFAGAGGEMILGALCVIGFYYRLPDPMRWDFFRFPLLLLGMYTFGRGALLWHRINAGLASIPRGSFRGADDANGDMNRLLYDHQIGESSLVGLYLSVALVCAVVILAHYVFFAWRAYRRRREPGAGKATQI